MPVLTIASGGKITLTKELLDHLGISAGGRIKVKLLPKGEARFSAATKKEVGDDQPRPPKSGRDRRQEDR